MQIKFLGLFAAFAIASVAALGDFETAQLAAGAARMAGLKARMAEYGIVEKRSEAPTGGESTESPLEAAQYKLHVIQDYRAGIASTNTQVTESTELTETEKAEFLAQSAVTDGELAVEEAAVLDLIEELSS